MMRTIFAVPIALLSCLTHVHGASGPRVHSLPSRLQLITQSGQLLNLRVNYATANEMLTGANGIVNSASVSAFSQLSSQTLGQPQMFGTYTGGNALLCGRNVRPSVGRTSDVGLACSHILQGEQDGPVLFDAKWHYAIHW
jgi:hypothetical protein